MCVWDLGKCLHNRAFVKRRCIDSWEGGGRLSPSSPPTPAYAHDHVHSTNVFLQGYLSLSYVINYVLMLCPEKQYEFQSKMIYGH